MRDEAVRDEAGDGEAGGAGSDPREPSLLVASTFPHHPIFARFPAQPVSAVVADDVDLLGVQTAKVMLPDFWQLPARGALPPMDEEYFEWIGLLEAVSEARGRFVMLEIGAGYGRWAVRGALAARRLGLECQLLLAEAEPQHAEWLRQHMATNGIAPDRYELVEAAVGTAAGSALFCVRMPEARAGNSPQQWYGQAIVEGWNLDPSDEPPPYHGRPAIRLSGGWDAIEVPVVPFGTILDRFDSIDLIDFDIQGEEAKVVTHCIDQLSAKVRRLHLGTHGRAIEEELHRTLHHAGWTCLRSYPCDRWNRTPYGWIHFVDGMQSWTNPRL